MSASRNPTHQEPGLVLGPLLRYAGTTTAAVWVETDMGSSGVVQIVCSPFRNPLTKGQRRVIRLTNSRPAVFAFAKLARLCKVSPSSARWAVAAGPTFQNSIGELELDSQSARVTINCSATRPDAEPLLRPRHVRQLS